MVELLSVNSIVYYDNIRQLTLCTRMLIFLSHILITQILLSSIIDVKRILFQIQMYI